MNRCRVASVFEAGYENRFDTDSLNSVASRRCLELENRNLARLNEL